MQIFTWNYLSENNSINLRLKREREHYNFLKVIFVLKCFTIPKSGSLVKKKSNTNFLTNSNCNSLESFKNKHSCRYKFTIGNPIFQM